MDYEVGKPSVFNMRKAFILEKLEQARSLAERITIEPKGTNIDVSWAKIIDWRLVSSSVEFAWHLHDPLFDEDGLPRVLQVSELMDNLTDGAMPAKSLNPMFKNLRDFEFKGDWYLPSHLREATRDHHLAMANPALVPVHTPDIHYGR
ncbi:MAG: hypothetical protein WCF47_21175 [Pseudolabrys sp.]